MKINDLSRVKMVAPSIPPMPDFGSAPDEGKLLATLASDSSEVLKYWGLTKEANASPFVQWQYRKRMGESDWEHYCHRVVAEGKLARTLEHLGLEIIDQSSVEKFKNDCLVNFNFRSPRHTGWFAWLNHFETRCATDTFRWEYTPLNSAYEQSGYHQGFSNPKIPEFVLAKAVQLKKEMPKGELYIDRCYNYFLKKVHVAFLVFRYEGGLYKSSHNGYSYIEVCIDGWKC